MPQHFESSITNLDGIPEDECKHIPLNCLWSITSQDASQAVITTCLNWTLNYEFCLRVTAYPLGAPNVTEQRDLDDQLPLPRSLTDALHLYGAILESHLKFHQLEILEELLEYLHYKF